MDQYRNRGQGIQFSIEVTRAVTERVNLDPLGHLLDTATLINNGVVSATARLRVAAFDVDANIDQSLLNNGVRPEIDQVFVNGTSIGVITGVDGKWAESTFDIPIGLIRFPVPCDLMNAVATCVQDTSGNFVPIPRTNTIRIDIDQGNISAAPSVKSFYGTDQLWRVAVDWGAISFQAMSPTIFIHGLNSEGVDGDYFRNSFRGHRLLFDNSINLPGQPTRHMADSIACNARRLAGVPLTGCQSENIVIRNFHTIPAIARRFGVEGVHLVTHSKGGMDARDYIARFTQPADILSLTTIGTPHKGTALADLAYAVFNAARLKFNIGLLKDIGLDLLGLEDKKLLLDLINFFDSIGITDPSLNPNTFRELAGDSLADFDNDGARDLTVNATLNFNIRNLNQLRPPTQYFAISADADRNGDFHLGPDEREGLSSPESADLGYRFLGTVQTVDTRIEEFCYTAICIKTFLGNIGGFRTAPVGVAIPSAGFQANDGVVTVNSAQDFFTFQDLRNFAGNDALNHFTLLGVGDPQQLPPVPVADFLIPHLQTVETDHGDFR